jgi:hypothetical protein
MPVHACVPCALTCMRLFLLAVAVLGGEAAYTGLSTDSSRPGRPTVPGTLLGVAGTLGVRDSCCFLAPLTSHALADIACIARLLHAALLWPITNPDPLLRSLHAFVWYRRQACCSRRAWWAPLAALWVCCRLRR